LGFDGVDDELLSGKYKSPLLPQPDSAAEILITARKAIIAVKSQLTQQIFLNIGDTQN
jgi:hypothetical protein